MTRFIPTFCLLLIPAFAALVHDIVLFVLNPQKGFLFSDYGYIWTQYFPDSYREFIATATGSYREFMMVLLESEAFLAGAVFAVGFFVLMTAEYLVLKLLFGRMGGRAVRKPSRRHG